MESSRGPEFWFDQNIHSGHQRRVAIDRKQLEPPSIPGRPALQTIDLLAPDDFKYQSSKKVRFVVEALSLENRRAFVSIFSEYQLTDSQGWRPNFGSRILIQKLIDGQLEVSLMIDNNVKRVLIEIWTDRSEEQPYVLESVIENGELVWRI